MAQLKYVSAGLLVSEAMVSELKALPATATLNEAAEAVLHTSQPAYAVVEETGRVLGILAREDIISALSRRSGDAPVGSIVRRHLPVVRPDDPLDKAFVKMQQSGYPALPVVDFSGRLVGLITEENVGEMMLLKTLRPKEGKTSWRLAPV